MFLKTKENKIKAIIVSEVVVLLILIVVIVSSNRITVLDKVGKLFNVNETNKTGETVNNGTGIQTLSVENWDTNKVNIVEDTEGVKVPVPKGYVASGAEGEHTVNTGFVIYEGDEPVTTANAYEQSKIRNQWVWVPVPDTSRIYERDSTTGKAKAKLWSFATTGRIQLTSSNYVEPGISTIDDNEKNFAKFDMQGMTRTKFLEELETKFEETMESIEKYGGFYIGRYETGNVSFRNKKPVIQRMNTNINYVTWYDAYNNMQNIQRNENIKSNIIWGCLWDETLQWLVDSGSKNYEEIKNSVTWGNNYDAEFDYINTNGAVVHKNANSATRLPAGSSEQNKANNIYDMAGNILEWTLEADNIGNRRYRGNYYYSTKTTWSVDYRNTGSSTHSDSAIGVRAYLYIK